MLLFERVIVNGVPTIREARDVGDSGNAVSGHGDNRHDWTRSDRRVTSDHLRAVDRSEAVTESGGASDGKEEEEGRGQVRLI